MEVDSLRIAHFGGIRQLEAWLDRPMLAPIELGIIERTYNGCSPILGFHVRLVTCDGHVLCIGRTLTMVYPFHLHHVCVRSCTVPSCTVWPRPFVFGWDQVHPSTKGSPRAQFTWWRCDGSSSSPSMRWKTSRKEACQISPSSVPHRR